MTIKHRFRQGLLAAAVTATAVLMPAAAYAAEESRMVEDVDIAVKTTPVAAGLREGVAGGIEITNTGTKPIADIWLRVSPGHSNLEVVRDYGSCGWDQEDESLYCRLRDVLAPGSTYVLSNPVLFVFSTNGSEAKYEVELWTAHDAARWRVIPPKLAFNTRAVKSLNLVNGESPDDTPELRVVTESNRTNNVATGEVKFRFEPGPDPKPTTTAEPKPTTTAEPSASLTASPGTSTSTGTGGAGGSDGGLPLTGAPVGAMISAAAGLIMLGGLGLLVARRRRTRFDV